MILESYFIPHGALWLLHIFLIKSVYSNNYIWLQRLVFKLHLRQYFLSFKYAAESHVSLDWTKRKCLLIIWWGRFDVGFCAKLTPTDRWSPLINIFIVFSLSLSLKKSEDILSCRTLYRHDGLNLSEWWKLILPFPLYCGS